MIAHYLNRPLLVRIEDLLRPGGYLVMAHPTIHNLERHDRPPRNHLLGPGELPGLIPGLEIVFEFEGWTDEERHEAQVVARRPRPSGSDGGESRDEDNG